MYAISTELAADRSRQLISSTRRDRLAHEFRASRAVESDAAARERAASDSTSPGGGAGTRSSRAAVVRPARRWRLHPLNGYQHWLAAGRL